MESQLTGDVGQLGHVFLMTPRIAADKVGDDLLIEVLLAANAVELALELIELLERRLAHKLEHTVAGVLRCHFQASADVMADEFTGVFLCGTVGGLVFTFI